jgi:poly[(R)-3-hydroxyalkanoate] polymerase subunit PhaC
MLGSVFADARTVDTLSRRMEAKGYLEAKHMARTFDLLRAPDLIFNYVASNWLMGETPPAFDLLAWNNDSTRMPAKMHSFYLRKCYLENALARNEMQLAGVPLHVTDVHADTYIVAAIEDHIVPWPASYKSTQIFKGDVRFVLSSAGHIAGIVNPPSPKTWHWVNDDLSTDADSWLERAERRDASWWEDWTAWIAERAGEQREPPPLGTELHPALGDAPGTYVLAT